MACSRSPLAFTGFHGARTITGAGAATHMLGRFRTSLFRIEFQGHENVSAKCLETSPRNVSRKHLREKRFSDEQGRIRHTGVSSSFRGVETISILSFIGPSAPMKCRFCASIATPLKVGRRKWLTFQHGRPGHRLLLQSTIRIILIWQL